MNDHPRRFVHDDEIGVLVQNLERKRLALWLWIDGCRLLDRYVLTGAQRPVGLRHVPGDLHLPLLDQSLNLRA